MYSRKGARMEARRPFLEMVVVMVVVVLFFFY
jgi:hypothetical protein